MENLNLNHILNRRNEEEELINHLIYFEANKANTITRRGVYVYGAPGSGKSAFVKNILTKLNYDIIVYDAGDVRNKTIIENITKHNMSDINILSLFKKEKKKIAILMDEIDGMNGGDKGGINSLIRLIRPKKTKKQKKEKSTMIPIICIGNYHVDKKIKEMKKVCHTIELKKPTEEQIQYIAKLLMPTLDTSLVTYMSSFIQGDLRKFISIYNIYRKQQSIFNNNIVMNMFQPKTFSEDTKEISHKLLNHKYDIHEHGLLMNETDRTSVGLLFHENIIDTFSNISPNVSIPLYIGILNNICFSDYVDRITFQKQIWIFNEMSSLIKTFYNHILYHDTIDTNIHIYNPEQVRFTKVLTKYSTEYNNMLFIQNLCKQLSMDKQDMISFFFYMRKKYDIEEIYEIFDNENYDISKLDINRMYRYLDRYTSEEY